MRPKRKQWKIKISTLIAVCLILTGIPVPGFINSVQAAEVQDDVFLYSEDFEKADYLTATGTSLISALGYTTNITDAQITAGTTDFAVVAEEGNESNHVLKFGYHTPESGAANPNVKFALSEGVTKAVLQYRFKMSGGANTGTFYLPRFRNGTDLNYSAIDGSNNSQYFREQGSIANNAKINTSDWNSVEVVLDTTTDKYDIYLNDTVTIQDTP